MQVPHDWQAAGTGDALDAPTCADEFIDDEVEDEEGGRDEKEVEGHCVAMERLR